jgi:hypothetical protein
MKKFDTNMPFWKYKLREALWLYDDLSEKERILVYRLG